MGNAVNKGRQAPAQVPLTANKVSNSYSDEQSETELIKEDEFIKQFKHKHERGDEAYSIGRSRQVIDEKLLQNHKYEIFRNEIIKQHFVSANIEIVDIIKYGRGINIYRGKHDNKHLVAIKLVDLVKLSVGERYFQTHDIDIRQRVRHRRIIHFYYIAYFDNKIFITMEYGPKGSIDDVIRDNGPFSEKTSMIIFVEICKGVQYMHRKKIAHRNIKLENIILNRNNIPKLSGFKYAVDFDGVNLITTHCGNVPYLAPEILSELPYNPFPSDIWSLGVCLFCMCNDSMPYRTNNIRQLIVDQQTKNIKFRPLVLCELSDDYKKFIFQILEYDIRARITFKSMKHNNYCKSFKTQEPLGTRKVPSFKDISMMKSDEGKETNN